MKLKPFEIQMNFPPQWLTNGPPDLSRSHPDEQTGAAKTTNPAPSSEGNGNNGDATLSSSTIRQWIEGLDEAIVVLDSGIIVGANSRAPSLFGRTDGAMQGHHLKELVTEESLMRLAHFLEFDDPEPALVLGVRKDQRTFPLKVKAIASIVGNGRRLRVTMLTRCGALDKPGDPARPPPD